MWAHLKVVDAEAFRSSVFYNELYRPLGDDTARCLGVVLDRPQGHLAIGLHRAYGQTAFEAGEVAALQCARDESRSPSQPRTCANWPC